MSAPDHGIVICPRGIDRNRRAVVTLLIISYIAIQAATCVQTLLQSFKSCRMTFFTRSGSNVIAEHGIFQFVYSGFVILETIVFTILKFRETTICERNYQRNDDGNLPSKSKRL